MNAVNLDAMRHDDTISRDVIDHLEEMLNCTGLRWFDRTTTRTRREEGIVSVGWNVLGFPMTIYVTSDLRLQPNNKRFKLWGQGGGIMSTSSFHEGSDLIGCFDDTRELWGWLCEMVCTHSQVLSLSAGACDRMGLVIDGIGPSQLFDAWMRWAIDSRQAYHFEDDPAQQVLTGSNGQKAFNAREVRQMHAIVRTAEFYNIDLCEVYMRISEQIEGLKGRGWFQMLPVPSPFPRAYGR